MRIKRCHSKVEASRTGDDTTNRKGEAQKTSLSVTYAADVIFEWDIQFGLVFWTDVTVFKCGEEKQHPRKIDTRKTKKL